MPSTYELVRVRVLFLEPGHRVLKSDLEDCLTNLMTGRADAGMAAGDYEEDGYLKPSTETFFGFLAEGDGWMDVLKPFVVVYFDHLDICPDWSSACTQEAVANIGLWDMFGGYLEKFIYYARKLKLHEDGFGKKARFLTRWRIWSQQSWDGEWDGGEEFAGIVTEIKSISLDEAMQVPVSAPVSTKELI